MGAPPATASRGAARQEPAVSIVALTPARLDSLLVCTLETRGLPDHRSRETLSSGLPSAIVVLFSLLGPSDDEMAESRVEIRIEPDLWENLLVVRTPLLEARGRSLDDVVAHLASLGPLPVAPLAEIGQLLAREKKGNASMRLRARMALQPLAPAEQERVRSLFGSEGDEEDSGRREVSIGLGTLVRFFLRGAPEEDWVADVTSAAFTVSGLPFADPESDAADAEEGTR